MTMVRGPAPAWCNSCPAGGYCCSLPWHALPSSWPADKLEGMKKLLPLLFLSALGAASFDHLNAGMQKTGHYIVNGFFNGGSKEITSARLKDVRRGPQGSGVER